MNETEKTSNPEPVAELSPVKRALLAVEQMKAKLDAAERARTEPIAIVGIGCRFPGAAGPEAYWDLLRRGGDAVREIPSDRWRIDDYYDPDPAAPGKMYTRRAGLIDRVDQFDPQFFGISPREAAGIDPQQRLLLEVCWEALEDAGQAPDRLRNSATGVYVGLVTSDYATMWAQRNDLSLADAYSQSGLAFSIASGRLSYVLGLQGPCMSIDTACSSSLVAVHLAAQALRLGECRMAVAGGVHLILLPDNSVCYSRARMLAPDGRCKTFDATADGFVEGEGCGIVVLKRLSDALADRDRIVAVIRGSAVNQDGPSGGLTVPNGPSQEAVIREALARSPMAPARIGYLEAHGTGTSLGDPIEVRALGAVLRAGRAADDRLFIGSVKTNIGHLQSAAGIAGLIKLALALGHGEIPAHRNFTTPSPHIPWSELPVVVPTTTLPWPRGATPRAGGVSAFGFSGTNAHVIVEEAPPVSDERVEQDRPIHVLTVTAASESSLSTLAQTWADRIETLPEGELPSLAYAANTGRAQLSHRLAVTARQPAALAAALRGAAAGESVADVSRGTVSSSDRPKLAFLFTGQGAQYAGMARRLYETAPVFRTALDRCDAALASTLERSLLSVIFADATDQTINQTAYTQPALFAVEYALAELWRSWGVVPGAVLGHSVGEYVGACIAGVFSVERALALVAARGRLMQSLPAGGAMSAVLADEATVRSAMASLGGRVSIAAVNGPRQVVVSGAAADVQAVTSRLAAEGITSEALVVSHAFHSALMDPILDAFEAAVREAAPAPPLLNVVSNLTGRQARQELTDPTYWRRHLREAVRFADGVRTMHASGYRLFVEIGPRAVLSTMAQRVFPGELVCLPSLKAGEDDWERMLGTVRELYVRGVEIDWEGFDRPYPRRRLALPTYPFERQRYWFADAAARKASGPPATEHPLLGAPVHTALKHVVFDRTLHTDSAPYLIDHRKHGTTLFPATAYLEMGLAAADALFGAGVHRFDDLMIGVPLALPSTGDVQLQVVLTPEQGGAAFQLFSRAGDLDWQQHATGTLRRGGSDGDRAELDAIRSRCRASGPDAPADYYAVMRAEGHEFGPAFQVIRSLEQGEGCAIARVALADQDRADAARYRIHPALLDGTLQLIGAAMPPLPANAAETYLPVTLEQVTVNVAGRAEGWAAVVVRQADTASRTLAADAWLFDDGGSVIASITGVYMKPVRKDALVAPGAGNDWVHDVAWIEKPIGQTVRQTDGAWLVLADSAGVADGVVRALRSEGRTCVVVRRTGSTAPGEAVLDPADRDALTQFYRTCSTEKPLAGIVCCWPVDAPMPLPNGVPTAGMTGGPIELLTVVQAATAEPADATPRFWVITQGARAIAGEAPALAQAAALGLSRSISGEYPELQCTTIDLAPGIVGEREVLQLVAELRAPDAEDQIAHRDGRRLVARVRQVPVAPERAGGSVALEIARRGVLDTLALAPKARRVPGPGEVEIRVQAAGLNFRDVLNAMGMYEGPAGALGSEFVGTVTSAGDGVAIDPGTAVMGMSGGAFGSYVVVDAATVAPTPQGLALEDVATLPIVFLTALYALEDLAQVRRGERVLIHAGTGGVGLAAIQVARRIGAEIFATAGSDAKRAHLRALGIEHVFSSRTLDFAEQIRTATGGQGVDVVLNSLTGDFIPANLAALAANGRFVEIGKAGIWSVEQMAAARPDVRYFTLYLGDLAPATQQQLYARLSDGVAREELRPIPSVVYPLADAEQAFRFMAQARHIGKVVLRVDEPEEVGIRGDASYLVTGAFGGLGRIVAEWLVDQGARHLVLVSRGGARGDGARLVDELTAKGVTVTAAAVDVADGDAVARLIASLPSDAPLKGVIHAAGVLDDGVLAQQSRARFDTVFAPKVAGAWHLHEHTAALPLDFFFLFSSMVTIVGAPGQGNYAAANAVLDGLAPYRRARGLRATTINWGPWADVGMSASVSEQDRTRWLHQGLSLIGRREGTALLQRFLNRAPAQVAVLPVQWGVLLQQFPPGRTPALYEEMARGAGSASSAASVRPGLLLEQLREAPASRRAMLAQDELSELARKILGLGAGAALDPRRPLQDYGLDSLMAVELRNSIGGLLDRTLPATLLFKYPTIEAVVGFVLESLPPSPASPVASPAQSTEPDQDAAAIASLSEDEVKRLLADEIESLSLGLLDDN